MPMPTPRPDESKDAFISRFMRDPVMVKEYPDKDQRLAVAMAQWRKSRGGK